jgi:hypothetical protein
VKLAALYDKLGPYICRRSGHRWIDTRVRDPHTGEAITVGRICPRCRRANVLDPRNMEVN